MLQVGGALEEGWLCGETETELWGGDEVKVQIQPSAAVPASVSPFALRKAQLEFEKGRWKGGWGGEGEDVVPDWGASPGEVGIENRSGKRHHEGGEAWWQPGNTGTFQIVEKQEVSPSVPALWARQAHLLLGTCPGLGI